MGGERPYKRGDLSLGDSLVVLYYLSTSDLWPDKRDVLWWEVTGLIRGVTSL